MKKLILYFIISIVLYSSVYALGVCNLDKDNYYLGDTALVSCSCTLGGEQNKVGYFVWKRSDDTILRSVATNSGPCASSFFGDSYSFINGGFEGNVTFSTNADGTGTPVGWGDPDDRNYDNFTFTNYSDISCFIAFENITGEIRTFDLGRLAAARANVYDQITEDYLIGANCHVDVITVGGSTVLQEPYEEFVKSSAFGGVVFQHFMGEEIWLVNTTYILTAHCFCGPPNTEYECYNINRTNYNITGVKHCETATLFVTGEDLREDETININQEPNLVGFLLAQAILIIVLAFLGYVNQKSQNMLKMSFWLSLISWIFCLVEIIITAGLVWLMEANAHILPLLKANWYVILLVGTGIGILTIIKLVTKSMDMDADDFKKW